MLCECDELRNHSGVFKVSTGIDMTLCLALQVNGEMQWEYGTINAAVHLFFGTIDRRRRVNQVWNSKECPADKTSSYDPSHAVV